MDKAQRKNLVRGLLFIIGVPVMLGIGYLIYCLYWLTGISGGNSVVNEIGEPLAIGDVWSENELFSLSLEGVTEIKWDDPIVDEISFTEGFDDYKAKGYKLYNIHFSVTNLNYQGYTDGYQSNKPLIKGLFFWADVTGCGAQKEALEIKAIENYEKFPEVPLMIGETAENNQYLVLIEPGVEKISIKFTTNREAKNVPDKRNSPRPIYKQIYECSL